MKCLNTTSLHPTVANKLFIKTSWLKALKTITKVFLFYFNNEIFIKEDTFFIIFICYLMDFGLMIEPFAIVFNFLPIFREIQKNKLDKKRNL